MVKQETALKTTMQQFNHFCCGCKKLLDPTIETSVIEIRVGAIKYGIFNRAYNYPAQYVHEECYETYLQSKVELRSQYASDCDKRNPS